MAEVGGTGKVGGSPLTLASMELSTDKVTDMSLSEGAGVLGRVGGKLGVIGGECMGELQGA